jgi:hypothetical protein
MEAFKEQMVDMPTWLCTILQAVLHIQLVMQILILKDYGKI